MESRKSGYLMLERYFIWCRGLGDEVLRHQITKPLGHTKAETGLDVVEYKVAGLIGHWIASLCPVIEGWEELKLFDEAVSELLDEGAAKGFRDRLFAFRNGVLHFQRRADDGRFAEFMDTTGEAQAWALRLDRAFEAFFSDMAESHYTKLNEWLTR